MTIARQDPCIYIYMYIRRYETTYIHASLDPPSPSCSRSRCRSSVPFHDGFSVPIEVAGVAGVAMGMIITCTCNYVYGEGSNKNQ